MLFQTPRLGEDELRALQRIAELKERLAYAVQNTPRRWQGMLRRSALARAVQGSNSIEGYDVTIEDAISVGLGEEPLDADSEAVAAVQGYQQAMTYVLQLANDPHFKYSTDLVRSLHFMMLQYDLAKNPGRWRPGPIYVRDDEKKAVVYEGPSADVVAGLTEELIDRLNVPSDEPSLVTAAMGHFNLVMIHPFSDGNGRMARCLQTLVLARAGTLAPQFSSVEEYLGKNTRAYYDVLADVGGGSWQPSRDARPWLRFSLTAHFQQATTVLRRAREIERLWDFLEEEIRAVEIPGRLIYALSDAAVGWRVRNATYRPVAEISDQLATKDLGIAVKAGLLIPKGERRGRYYERSPRLAEIRKKTREPRPVADDPFAPPSDQLAFSGVQSS